MYNPDSTEIITNANIQETTMIKLDNFNRKNSIVGKEITSKASLNSEVAQISNAINGSASTQTESGNSNLTESSFEYFENPTYPKVARERSIEGYVRVEIHFSDNGAVENILILDSSKSTLLEEATLASIRKWKLKTTVKRVLVKNFEFKLN